MSRRQCPALSCTGEVPAGPYAVFCPDCHFRLPYNTTKQIFALQIAASRSLDDEERLHLKEQVAAHIRIATQELDGGARHAA